MESYKMFSCNKGRKTLGENGKKRKGNKEKMAPTTLDVGSVLSMTSLNVNGLNTAVKKREIRPRNRGLRKERFSCTFSSMHCKPEDLI